MGIFTKKRTVQEGAKTFLIIQYRPITSFVMLFFCISMGALPLIVYYLQIAKSSALEAFKIFAYVWLGIFVLALIRHQIESWPITRARFDRREIRVTGGWSVFHVKNPPETWVEQRS